jgi:hypothetical protein
MRKGAGPLEEYARRYGMKAQPPDFLSGDIGKREATIVLSGKKSDDLNGAVRRRLLSDINRYFWEHPRDADDTRLIFEATEKGSKYEEGSGGSAKLVLKIEIGLASSKPQESCC